MVRCGGHGWSPSCGPVCESNVCASEEAARICTRGVPDRDIGSPWKWSCMGEQCRRHLDWFHDITKTQWLSYLKDRDDDAPANRTYHIWVCPIVNENGSTYKKKQPGPHTAYKEMRTEPAERLEPRAKVRGWECLGLHTQSKKLGSQGLIRIWNWVTMSKVRVQKGFDEAMSRIRWSMGKWEAKKQLGFSLSESLAPNSCVQACATVTHQKSFPSNTNLLVAGLLRSLFYPHCNFGADHFPENRDAKW